MIESDRIANALRVAIQAAQQRQQDSPLPEPAPVQVEVAATPPQDNVASDTQGTVDSDVTQTPEKRLQQLFQKHTPNTQPESEDARQLVSKDAERSEPSTEPPAQQDDTLDDRVTEPIDTRDSPASDPEPSAPEPPKPIRQRVRKKVRRSKSQVPANLITSSAPDESDLEPSPLLTFVDYCIAALLIVVPLVMGGRQPFGHFILSTLAIGLSGGWLLYLARTKGMKWDWSPITLLMLLGIAVVAIQIIPLPGEQVQSLLPPLQDLLPLWSGSDSQASVGTWGTISLSPAQTQRGLVTLIAHVLIFVTVTQRVQSTKDIERIITCLAVMSGGMAAFGLLQFLTSNGKFFWVYDHPFYSTDAVPKGSFGNQNHFAHFIVLGIPSIVYLMIRQRRLAAATDDASNFELPGQQTKHKAILWLCGIALLFIAFAVLRSESRGGVAALLLMLVMCVPLLKQVGKVDIRAAGTVSAVVAGLGVVLMIYGDDFLLNRVDTLFSADLDEIDNAGSRRAVWSANQQIIEKYTWTGTGVGSHVEVYPTYLDAIYDGKEYTHAESGFLQVGQETGVPGLILVGAIILLAVSWCVRGIATANDSTTVSLFLIMLAMLIVNAAHSVGDFMWYIPGCMVGMVVIGACAQKLWIIVRVESGRVGRQFSIPRPAWAIAAGGLVCLGGWMLHTLWAPTAAETHYAQFVRLDRFRSNESDESRDFTNRRIAALVACVEADPDDARAHLRLANEYRELFRLEQTESENRMGESQLKDAVYASGFPDIGAAQAWLEVAIGPNLEYLRKALAHARRSLELCPMQGLGYVYLSQLSFLESTTAELPKQYMQQAIALRPFDPHVQFAAGRDAWLAGNRDDAVQHWNVCYSRHRNYQRFIIWLTAEHVDAPFFIKNFDSDVMALEEIKRVYKYIEREDDVQLIRQVLVQLYLQTLDDVPPKRAQQYLVRAHVCFAELGDDARAEACIQAAAKRDGNSLETRLALGRWKFRTAHYAEAADHLAWCARQSPSDEGLQRLARKALDAKLNPNSKWILEDTADATLSFKNF